jgi:regulator of sigma E protease
MEHGLLFFIDAHMGQIFMIAMLPFMAALVFFVHEFGHYLAARLCGVRVQKVVIGFGRTIWRHTDRRGTEWNVRMLPMCGFAHLAHEDKGGAGHNTFGAQAAWKKFLIVAAGPLSNIFLAWVLFTLYFVAIGQPSTPPYVTGVEVGSPADQAGFKSGDRVLALNGAAVERYDDIWSQIREAGKPLSFLLMRNGYVIDTEATPVRKIYTDGKGTPDNKGRLGALPLHQGLRLNLIMDVDGHETEGDPDKARALLLDRMEQDIVIGIRGEEGRIHEFRVNIDPALNPGLQEGAPRVFLGRMQNNFYLQRGLLESMGAAGADTKRLLSGISQVMGRIAGTDDRLVEPEVWVSRDVSQVKHAIFVIFYAGICLSLSIALLNILPIPGFDGYLLLRYIVEMAMGRSCAAVLNPYVMRFAIALLICAFIMVNFEALAALVK